MWKVLLRCLAAAALLCSSAALAATATIVASTASPAVGDSFFITVSGAGFPPTTGATLGLTWNASVVSVTDVTMVPGSPFPDLVATAPYDLISVLGPLSGAQPSGAFEVFRVTFKALAAGNAGITIVDDGVDKSWTDADTLAAIPVTYTQASVTVAKPVSGARRLLGRIVTPLPGAAWLFGPALGLLGFFRRSSPAA